jgi:hypothetical protein
LKNKYFIVIIAMEKVKRLSEGRLKEAKKIQRKTDIETRRG